MRLLLALLLGATPAHAAVAVRPSLGPSLPSAGLPTPVLVFAPALSAAPTLAASLPAQALAVPALPRPAVLAPAHAAAVPAAAAPGAPLASLAAVAASVAPAQGPAPSPARAAAASAAFFDGSAARDAAGAVALPAFSGVTERLEGPAFRGELQGDQGAVAEPGSIFGWRPWSEAPTHGLPFVDRLVAKAFDSKARRPDPGFEFRGAPSRSAARVFLYGENHSDKALIAANMARLAADMDPRAGGIVLVEGYLGSDLHGTEAVLFLERRGLDPDLWAEKGVDFTRIVVRGWDEPQAHDASTPLVLRHHMELLALNHLMYEGRGLLYYPRLAAQAARTAAAWVRMRAAAIGLRNAVLDRAVADAVARRRQAGGTVHVVSGSEHFLEKPAWLSRPVGRARLREGLAAALGEEPYWAEKPAESR